jgi:hypothetical protein
MSSCVPYLVLWCANILFIPTLLFCSSKELQIHMHFRPNAESLQPSRLATVALPVINMLNFEFENTEG